MRFKSTEKKISPIAASCLKWISLNLILPITFLHSQDQLYEQPERRKNIIRIDDQMALTTHFIFLNLQTGHFLKDRAHRLRNFFLKTHIF